MDRSWFACDVTNILTSGLAQVTSDPPKLSHAPQKVLKPMKSTFSSCANSFDDLESTKLLEMAHQIIDSSSAISLNRQ